MPTSLKKISFLDGRLVVIVDREVLGGRDPAAVAEAAIKGGADCIQWRDKKAPDAEFFTVAQRLRSLTRQKGTLFVVNDRVAVAMLVEADGVHLGQEDLPLQEARRLVGPAMLIGRSTHSLAQAQEAQSQGADYIGVGPIFSTPTKPGTPAVGIDLIRHIKPAIQIPWVAIGGIDPKTLPLVSSAGSTRVAVVRAVTGAADPESAARALKTQLLSV